MNDESIPLVIVEGFLGSPGAICWGGFEKYLNEGSKKKRRVLFAQVGPVSSLHDRACELYCALKGGIVDYGKDHSEENGHARYGRRIEQGLYPEWSPRKPLHFLGHSMGGPTVTKLQYLLEKGHFGQDATPGMVLSLTSISSPFRGTQLVYLLGERTDAAPLVRPLSVGSLLTKWIHLISYLNPILPSFLDLHAESRLLSYRDNTIGNLLGHLWKSDWAEGRDATPFDVTFEAADEREANGEGRPWHATYYLSHVASIERIHPNSIYRYFISPLSSLISTPFYLTSYLMENFEFSAIQPRPSFLQEASNRTKSTQEYEEAAEQGCLYENLQAPSGSDCKGNDGIVPLFSQFHPLPCSDTKCSHHRGLRYSDIQPALTPGTWYVSQVEAANHISFVPFWIGSNRQKDFWRNTGQWLRAIDTIFP